MNPSSVSDTLRHGVLVHSSAGAVDIVWAAEASEARRMAASLCDDGLCADHILLLERHKPASAEPRSPRRRYLGALRLTRPFRSVVSLPPQ